MGEGSVLARWAGAVVAVRQGPIMGLAFHPELAGETAFHRALLSAAACKCRSFARRLKGAGVARAGSADLTISR